MGADQRPEVFLAVLKALERRLTVRAGTPLQVIEHPPSVFADLHTRIDKARVALGQAFALGGQGRHQGDLLPGFDLKLDQLSEAEILL